MFFLSISKIHLLLFKLNYLKRDNFTFKVYWCWSFLNELVSSQIVCKLVLKQDNSPSFLWRWKFLDDPWKVWSRPSLNWFDVGAGSTMTHMLPESGGKKGKLLQQIISWSCKKSKWPILEKKKNSCNKSTPGQEILAKKANDPYWRKEKTTNQLLVGKFLQQSKWPIYVHCWRKEKNLASKRSSDFKPKV